VRLEALDDALHSFATTGPEYSSLGLSNHGPMAAEAMDTLGRAESIPDWAAHYRARLSDAPAPGSRSLSEEEWQGALGQPSRYPEWLVLFEREFADRPAEAVIGEWAPRLLPGTIGAAAHGLIRTGHGLRALGGAETPARRLEVASGLAYWASQYQELPGPPLLIGRQGVGEVMADLPYLPEETPSEPSISDQVAHVADISDEFEQAVSSLAPADDAVGLLDQLATYGALAYLRNADRGSAIALVHAITSPLAFELLLPWLAREDRDAALGYAWQAVAALHVGYDIDRTVSVPPQHTPPTEKLIDHAIASRDEHAIKLTEAALRSFARCGEPTLLWAASDACARFAA
jgi:hypothetical protein